jgi:TPR repeat protein
MARTIGLLDDLLFDAEGQFAERDFAVGVLFLHGFGVPKDNDKAFEHFQCAARRSLPYAQYALGYMLETGKHGPVDLTAAFEWYEKAAKLGHGQGMCAIGIMLRHGIGVPQATGEAFQWFLRSAERRYSLGAVQLAECYEHGIGVAKDTAQAREWYLQAVTFKDAKVHAAYAALASIHREGRLGFPVDLKESESWHRRSTESDPV